MNDLEKLIELSKIIAKPWVIATYVLAFLLLLSVVGNIYLSTVESEITIEADYNNASIINQTRG